jgi:hypothetical protein
MAWPIFCGLFDDASLFAPASLAMADANVRRPDPPSSPVVTQSAVSLNRTF